MRQSAPRSLKHEYDLFVEDEIEAYKESISRATLLKIGDEAVASLQSGMQISMNELLLVVEVDKIIRKRLRLPSYATWRKRELKRQKERQEFMRPEYWGLSPDSAVAREIHPPADSRVLVAGDQSASAALYLAAQGCSVTAINGQSDIKASLLNNADVGNLPGHIDHHAEGLREWAPSPDRSLSAVVCTPAAFSGLTARQRAQVIGVLQSATEDGGVHLVATIIAGQSGVSLSELRKSYKGWEVSVVEDGASGKSFLARKAVA
ncbi:MAG: hypothetical protein M3O61_03475 [Gemmatimonadota bacterium]|nr:hypothetical protein [Gemmatimonadota bacterium]